MPYGRLMSLTLSSPFNQKQFSMVDERDDQAFLGRAPCSTNTSWPLGSASRSSPDISGSLLMLTDKFSVEESADGVMLCPSYSFFILSFLFFLFRIASALFPSVRYVSDLGKMATAGVSATWLSAKTRPLCQPLGSLRFHYTLNMRPSVIVANIRCMGYSTTKLEQHTVAPKNERGASKLFKDADEAVADIKSGSTILSSGFGLCGVAGTVPSGL